MSTKQDLKVQITNDVLNEKKVFDQYTEVKEEITDFVKNNPWACVGIAASIGFILGRLQFGRKK